MQIEISSFGFANGDAPTGNIVWDCRHLKDPHDEPRLRPLRGDDPEVGEWLAADPTAAAFLADLTALVCDAASQHAASERPVLSIRLGCAGGQHRSVWVSSRLAASLSDTGFEVSLTHRDRDLAPPAAD